MRDSERVLLRLFALYAFVQVTQADGGGKEDGWALNFISAVKYCNDKTEAWIDTSGIEVLQLNETTAVMDGIVKFLEGFPNDMMVEMEILRLSSGRAQKIATHEICGLCNEMVDPESAYAAYLKYLSMPTECPFEPGEYKVDNLQVETQDMPINSANAGDFTAKLVLAVAGDADCSPDKRTPLACLEIDFVIEKAF